MSSAAKSSTIPVSDFRMRLALSNHLPGKEPCITLRRAALTQKVIYRTRSVIDMTVKEKNL